MYIFYPMHPNQNVSELLPIIILEDVKKPEVLLAFNILVLVPLLVV